METEEVWKEIPTWEGMYMVSNIGNLKSLPRMVYNGVSYFEQPGRLYDLTINKKGYITIVLTGKGVSRGYGVHQLVAMAFLGHNSDGHLVVDHINGVKHDNRVENLRIVTPRFNVCLGYRNKREDCKTKYTGVVKCGKKWMATITINKVRKVIGKYDTEIEAGNAYQKVLQETIESEKYLYL